MKTLYLVRHAKSSWKQPELTDYERPLNNRGINDAPLMGKILSGKGITPDLIISSPAKRAAVTAKIISSAIGYPEKNIEFNNNIYDATGGELLKIISQTDNNYNSIMIFAHNPGLTILQNNLSDRFIDNIPTCGVVALQLGNSWNKAEINSAKFIFFEYPKKYK